MNNCCDASQASQDVGDPNGGSKKDDEENDSSPDEFTVCHESWAGHSIEKRMAHLRDCSKKNKIHKDIFDFEKRGGSSDEEMEMEEEKVEYLNNFLVFIPIGKFSQSTYSLKRRKKAFSIT